MRFPIAFLLAACCLAAAAPATALTVTVPDDYATIQAAVDAGADIVYVDQGVYHEVVSVSHDIELLPKPQPGPYTPVPFPEVDGLEIHYGAGFDRIHVNGFHFTGPVKQFNACRTSETHLEACRLDAGFATDGSCSLGHSVKLRGCLIFGDVYAYAYYPDFTACTIVGGSVTAHANGHGVVRDNLILGPADFGVSVPSPDDAAEVSGNIIRNVVDGVLAEHAGNVHDNLVEDVSGTGYRGVPVDFGLGFPNFHDNTARNCGLHGIEFASAGYAWDNTIENTGGCGIHGTADAIPDVRRNVISGSASHGIQLEGYSAVPVIGNTVLNAGGDGIQTNGNAYWNVVGRSTARGIVAGEAVANNTSFLNGGAGFQVATSGSAAFDSVLANIAYGNVGAGLVVTGPGTPAMSCNDWYANTGGATSGVPPGADDLAVDPSFCDLPGNDVHLSAISPLLAAPGCGPIGALGLGCATPVGVDAGAADRGAAFEVRPLPARDGMDFAWPPEAGAVRVDVYDVSGALRWSARADGNAGRLHWDGRDQHGAPVAPGMYFARRSAAAGGTYGTRVVVIR